MVERLEKIPRLSDTGRGCRDVDSYPLVSIIMIFFQADRFMSEAIESVLSQSFGNWELLLVDDGSLDGGTKLAKGYAANYPDKIRYIQHEDHENRGTGASRNLGLRMARGQYLAFLDADDLYMSNRLDKHIEVLERNPDVGVVISSELYWFSWYTENKCSETTELDYILEVGVTPNVIIEPPNLLTLMLTPHSAATPGICSYTYRRSALELPSMIPETFADQYEDQCLLAKLLVNERTIVVNECLAKYRQHSSSLTGRARARGEYADHKPAIAEEIYLRWLGDFVAQRQSSDRLLPIALAKRLYSYDFPIRAQIRSAPQRLLRACARASMKMVEIAFPDINREQIVARVRKWRWTWRQRRIQRQEAKAMLASHSTPAKSNNSCDI